MPSTPDAIAYLQQNGILFAPAKASNAGGVATSGLEMSQNSLRLSWTFEEVDERLHNIMVNIYHSAAATAEKYGMKGEPGCRCQHRRFREDRLRHDEPGHCLIQTQTAG